tara:strand:- start:88 stop:606 length:519 start_codon:yes stop_codon:yes gene_type:complete
MARITVEDCIDKFPSRFELVLVSSQRARKLHSGEEPTVDRDNDKNTVIALREIADSTITVEEMKENLIQEYQTITLNDEEEENLEIDSLESDNKDENKENQEESKIDNDIDEELKSLVSAEEEEIKEQYEVTENLDNDILSEENEEGSNISEENEEGSNSSEENEEGSNSTE